MFRKECLKEHGRIVNMVNSMMLHAYFSLFICICHDILKHYFKEYTLNIFPTPHFQHSALRVFHRAVKVELNNGNHRGNCQRLSV